MGYRIIYDGLGGVRTKTKLQPARLPMLLTAFLILFVLLTSAFWPDGKAKLRDLFIPGNPVVTQQAVSDLIQDLRNGEPLTDSVTTFCREIIEHAEYPD